MGGASAQRGLSGRPAYRLGQTPALVWSGDGIAGPDGCPARILGAPRLHRGCGRCGASKRGRVDGPKRWQAIPTFAVAVLLLHAAAASAGSVVVTIIDGDKAVADITLPNPAGGNYTAEFELDTGKPHHAPRHRFTLENLTNLGALPDDRVVDRVGRSPRNADGSGAPSTVFGLIP